MKLPTLCRQAHHGLEVLLKDFFSLFRTVAVEKSFSSETSVGSGVGEAEETCDLTDPPPPGSSSASQTPEAPAQDRIDSVSLLSLLQSAVRAA